MSKINYCSRANQWCNQHVNMLKHIDLAELRRSVGMMKWHFFVILVILGSKLGHFAFEIWPKIHEIIKLELKSQQVVQSASLYLFSFRFDRVLKMEGKRTNLLILFWQQFWQFSRILIYLCFRWTNLHEIGDQSQEFLMLYLILGKKLLHLTPTHFKSIFK